MCRGVQKSGRGGRPLCPLGFNRIPKELGVGKSLPYKVEARMTLPCGCDMDIREETIDDLLQARSEIDEELRRHKAKITVLFTDVVGSTNYFDRFGDTAGLLLLHRHDNYVSSAVVDFEGTIIKTIGDSVMAEFPHPLLVFLLMIRRPPRFTLFPYTLLF